MLFRSESAKERVLDRKKQELAAAFPLPDRLVEDYLDDWGILDEERCEVRTRHLRLHGVDFTANGLPWDNPLNGGFDEAAFDLEWRESIEVEARDRAWLRTRDELVEQGVYDERAVENEARSGDLFEEIVEEWDERTMAEIDKDLEGAEYLFDQDGNFLLLARHGRTGFEIWRADYGGQMEDVGYAFGETPEEAYAQAVRVATALSLSGAGFLSSELEKPVNELGDPDRWEPETITVYGGGGRYNKGFVRGAFGVAPARKEVFNPFRRRTVEGLRAWRVIHLPTGIALHPLQPSMQAAMQVAERLEGLADWKSLTLGAIAAGSDGHSVRDRLQAMVRAAVKSERDTRAGEIRAQAEARRTGQGVVSADAFQGAWFAVGNPQPGNGAVPGPNRFSLGTKDILRELDRCDTGLARRTRFEDFTTLASCSLQNQLHQPGSPEWLKHEHEYMGVMRRYLDRNRRDDEATYAGLVGRVMLEMQSGHRDVLGPAWEQLVKPRDRLINPPEMARLLAATSLTEDSVRQAIEERGYVSMYDAWAGAGNNTLAAAAHLSSMGFDPRRHLHAVLVEPDPVAARVGMIQASAGIIPATVLHGDPLTGEVWRRWTTPASVGFALAHGLVKDGRPETPVPDADEIARRTHNQRHGQQSMFDVAEPPRFSLGIPHALVFSARGPDPDWNAPVPRFDRRTALALPPDPADVKERASRLFGDARRDVRIQMLDLYGPAFIFRPEDFARLKEECRAEAEAQVRREAETDGGEVPRLLDPAVEAEIDGRAERLAYDRSPCPVGEIDERAFDGAYAGLVEDIAWRQAVELAEADARRDAPRLCEDEAGIGYSIRVDGDEAEVFVPDGRSLGALPSFIHAVGLAEAHARGDDIALLRDPAQPLNHAGPPDRWHLRPAIRITVSGSEAEPAFAVIRDALARGPFAVSRNSYDRQAIDEQPGWQITHLASGMRIVPILATREQAMSLAERLAETFPAVAGLGDWHSLTRSMIATDPAVVAAIRELRRKTDALLAHVRSEAVAGAQAESLARRETAAPSAAGDGFEVPAWSVGGPGEGLTSAAEPPVFDTFGAWVPDHRERAALRRIWFTEDQFVEQAARDMFHAWCREQGIEDLHPYDEQELQGQFWEMAANRELDEWLANAQSVRSQDGKYLLADLPNVDHLRVFDLDDDGLPEQEIGRADTRETAAQLARLHALTGMVTYTAEDLPPDRLNLPGGQDWRRTDVCVFTETGGVNTARGFKRGSLGVVPAASTTPRSMEWRSRRPGWLVVHLATGLAVGKPHAQRDTAIAVAGHLMESEPELAALTLDNLPERKPVLWPRLAVLENAARLAGRADAAARARSESDARRAAMVPSEVEDAFGASAVFKAAEAVIGQADIDALALHIRDRVQAGGAWPSIVHLRKEAEHVLGQPIRPGSLAAKAVEEATEAGAVMAAAALAAEGRPAETVFAELRGIAARLPNLSTRTSSSVRNQAYSTPLPISYVAARLAGVRAGKTVADPTAGHGALLLGAETGQAFVNEIDPARADRLEAMGFTVTREDAADWRPRDPVDRIVANPPFGSLRAVSDLGGPAWKLTGGRVYLTPDGIATRVEPGTVAPFTTSADQAIAWNTLSRLKPDGRAVLILEAPLSETADARRQAYETREMRGFMHELYNRFNVVDHVTLAGDLYSTQGASWPVDMIIIDGRGRSARPLPAALLPERITTLDHLAAYAGRHAWGELLDAKAWRFAEMQAQADADRKSTRLNSSHRT